MSELRTRRWPDSYDLKDECSLRGTNICWKFADSVGCSSCVFATSTKDADTQDAQRRWDATLALLPKDIDELAQGNQCWFCVEDPESSDGYALLDMAHQDPPFEKGILFGYGKKVRSPVGSLVTVPVRIGKRCRSAIRMVDLIQIGWLIGMFVLSVLLLMIPALADPMVNLFPLLPVIFVALMTFAGWWLGRNLSLFYVSKKAAQVRFDPGKIPLIRQMLDRGWYFFQTQHGLPRMSFSRKLPQSRLFPPAETLLTDNNENDTL